ncbi:MAG: response regulator transcription factor [Dokdonella sp.]|uniref:response regulator transcription factor n=1 Tax=Dokdonella sp. TaxID=2291710 RepID=UPI0025C74104|nr:response regulator transcription factor [Dokdonella sp.]MBZ0222991.1 response regulator transcription factor [Dokdonella sp.]MCC7256422.1 response regulator transcription factor [Dokdonella sp.]
MRVLLLEDDADAREVVREAIATLNGHQIELQEAHTLSQCRDRLDREPFDLLLADLVLPDGPGIDAIRHACALPAPPLVLVISSMTDEDCVVEAILAGAKGYASKLDPPEEIARSIALAADGGSSISPTIAQRVVELLRRQGEQLRSPQLAEVRLTDSERTVLQLSAQGHSYRHIAEMTSTRPSTVYTHVRHIYEKLQVSNLAQALFEARRRRLV